MSRSGTPTPADHFPNADELAALRAWYAGLSARDAVRRYLPGNDGNRSARATVGRIRRALMGAAHTLHRDDIVSLLTHPEARRVERARAVAHAVETLRTSPAPIPQISDDIGQWLPVRAVTSLRARGITTLADLTVRIPRRRQWWKPIPGLGPASARHIEAFFAAHPALTERARALIATTDRGVVVPWESLRLPHEVDGSSGAFRAPHNTCTLDASDDYQAVKAWLSLHEAAATQRAYRKEAERLMLWSIVERARALSSLTTEDAIAYRTFLRRPTPRSQWVGPTQPRHSPGWRPFSSGLSDRSAAYALSVLAAMFRWLVAQRYLLANPFAGVKVRETGYSTRLDTTHVFTDGEWMLVRTVADGLEWSYGWEPAAAQRLRFVLDFAYGTGLRVSELVGARLGDVETDDRGDHWVSLFGKGRKAGKVALPQFARTALERYLRERRLPVTPVRWRPETPLVGSLAQESVVAISSVRLWEITRRFFAQAAGAVEDDNPGLAEKLRRASPHWMRHTHATHLLERGAALTTVRDNLRHASIATTSLYLHTDDSKRARQIRSAFAKG